MANINAPKGLTIVGNVKVVGNLDLTGGLTGAGPATMAGVFKAEDGVFAGVSFRNHTHAYVDGGGITQRPVGNI
jgi:hypothetical protein